jgi:hypothetical protein
MGLHAPPTDSEDKLQVCVTMTDRKYHKGNIRESIRLGAGYGSIRGYAGDAADCVTMTDGEYINSGNTHESICFGGLAGYGSIG